MSVLSNLKSLVKFILNKQDLKIMTIEQRVQMTASCIDSAMIPKVPNAGQVIDFDGERVQIMHEGTKVIADGYYGYWITDIIKKLKGHHEPQEEQAFHHILKHTSPGSLMVELGCFWAYYTNWFLGAVTDGKAICIEPDLNNLNCGKRNVALNNRNAHFIQAYIGKQYQHKRFYNLWHKSGVQSIPYLDFSDILIESKGCYIEIVHMDIQGAELFFIESMAGFNATQHVRFIFVSTHHKSISGSPNTHQECINKLVDLGAFILAEHSVEESFSGDGLIVASFNEKDKSIVLPKMTKNSPENSLFLNT